MKKILISFLIISNTYAISDYDTAMSLIKTDPKKALFIFETECDKKTNYSACYNAAYIIGMNFSGDPMFKNEMYSLLMKACDGNIEKACNVLKKLNTPNR